MTAGTTETRILHLLVRFSDKLFNIGDVSAKHNEVAAKLGSVWFGKMGTPISRLRIKALNDQIHQGHETFLYLLRSGRKPTLSRALLLEVARNIPKTQSDRVPKYYHSKGMAKYMRTWLMVKNISAIDMSSLKGFKALTSVVPLRETLASSSSGYFLIYDTKLE